MKIRALSKINLYLRVTGRRPNGYHEIETFFLPLESPADILDAHFRDDSKGEIVFTCSNPELENSGNLCVRAAKECFQKLSGPRPSLTIHLEKKIPVAAGMGGGSSDAASVIRAILERFPDLPAPEKIALGLGADIPFFLNPKPSVARGLGEELFPADKSLRYPPIVIAAPEFPVSAKWSYIHRDVAACNADSRTLEELLSSLRTGDFEKTARFLRNDLSHAVRTKFPLIRILEKKLMDAGALGTQITGSGPTIFGIFPDEKTASDARVLFQKV